MQKYNIYDFLEYGEEKVKVTPMLETPSSKEIRIVFKQGQIMKDHSTAFPITVEIFEGEIDFGVGEKIYTLVKGDIVSLEPKIVHNLKANADSIVRLTLSKDDSLHRVKSVLKL